MRFFITLVLIISCFRTQAQQIPFAQLVKMVGQKAVSVSDYFQENSWEFKGVDTSYSDPFTSSEITHWAYNYNNETGGAYSWSELTKNLRSDLIWDISISVTSSEYAGLFKKLPTYGFLKFNTNTGNDQGALSRVFIKGDIEIYLTAKPSDGRTYYTLEILKPNLTFDMSSIKK